jgi:hypothetical protein
MGKVSQSPARWIVRGAIVSAALELGGAVFCGCSRPPATAVLVHMLPQQEEFFKKEVASGFKKAHKASLDVIRYGSTDSIEEALGRHRGHVGLVKIPFDKSRSLMNDQVLKPLDSFLSKDEMREFNETYLLTMLGKSSQGQFLVPRKFETRILVYAKDKVADAVERWSGFKDTLNALMKQINGYGLPATYILEPQIERWDYFDVFVAGWVWAHTEYNGKTGPRVAHRGRRYSGTSLGLVDKVFQCGGDSIAVLSMDHEAVTDVFFWEAVYAAYGIFNKRMWEELWSGVGIWQGIADDDVYLSDMTQLDCFFIRGTGKDSLEGYIDVAENMGVSIMPRGVSVDVDSRGNPVRTGSRAITTGGWWWGIPADAPAPQVSYALARHITSPEIQMQEANRFGMIPVRKDILGDMAMMFGGDGLPRCTKSRSNNSSKTSTPSYRVTRNFRRLPSYTSTPGSIL